MPCAGPEGRQTAPGAEQLGVGLPMARSPPPPPPSPPPSPAEVDPCDNNINSYCSIDSLGRKPASQLTLGEKEALFLEALSVRARVCVCGGGGACRQEQQRWAVRQGTPLQRCGAGTWGHRRQPRVSPPPPPFHPPTAQSYYFEGKPSISNDEFDFLKDELVWAGSKVAVLRCERRQPWGGWPRGARVPRHQRQCWHAVPTTHTPPPPAPPCTLAQLGRDALP